jgi:hypothetical protein
MWENLLIMSGTGICGKKRNRNVEMTANRGKIAFCRKKRADSIQTVQSSTAYSLELQCRAGGIRM